jgi:predicted RNA binding protein YcfA (HicA-like mRNA interferase family)
LKRLTLVKYEVKGSHIIYSRDDVADMVNVQNDNGKAKPYQIKQFLSIIEIYNLKLEEE